MNYEEQILSLADENDGLVTTKEINRLGIPRFYLSKMVKEGYLKRVDRGIYASKEIQYDPLFNLQTHSAKVIISHFSALELLGFYKDDNAKIQISVPQGYNAMNLKEYECFYDNETTYQVGIIEVENKFSNKIKIYDLERSICDIIKNKNRFESERVNRLINYYFNLDNLDYQKLLYYSKLLRISEKVKTYLSLFKV